VRSEFRNTDCGLIADWPIRAKSTIHNPQPTIHNPQSEIRNNPQSALRNPQ